MKFYLHKEYEYFLAHNKSDAVVNRMIGICYYNLNNYNQSIFHFKNASTLFKNKDINTLYYYNNLYSALKN